MNELSINSLCVLVGYMWMSTSSATITHQRAQYLVEADPGVVVYGINFAWGRHQVTDENFVSLAACLV